ncbi:AAA family ATPase [Herbaspirillum sp. RV1423]|uniref:AAA family ATPase n=1 Tax=Herbaspirillum sp. RV1423 TaxID=1443993 RepID=UPI0004BCC8A7|nr:AAA family ATPase [Herbaspirillum sp. RV1423]
MKRDIPPKIGIVDQETTCTLSILNVLWYHPFRGQIISSHDEDGVLYRVRASRNAIIRRKCQPGEVWRIQGVWEEYNGGLQIGASSAELQKPTHGKLLVRYLKTHFDRIGQQTAQKLFNHFDERGENLVYVLDRRDLNSLLDVMSNRDVAEQLIEDWHDRMAETRIVIELDGLGLPISIAEKIFRVWGASAMDVVRANPYFLLALVSWNRVERVAYSLGIDGRDERRLVGAVEAALYRRLDEKHTLTKHVALRTRVINLLNTVTFGRPKWGQAGVQTGEKAIEEALAVGAIVGSRKTGYRTKPVEEMEEYLAARFKKMSVGEAPDQQDLFDINGKPRQAVWQELLRSLDDGEYLQRIFDQYESSHHPLTPQQREAVITMIENQALVLKGGAGTGKTSVMCVVHDMIEGAGGVIHQMALAGRAKERMKEATGRPAMTIAKFLNDIRREKIILQPDDLIIVDEASMIGLSTMYRIVRAMPKGARLLLVGDPGQLPPIEFGLTFHVLASEQSVVKNVELTIVHRQAAATGIPTIADNIRHGRLPSLSHYEGLKDGVSFVPCEPDQIKETIYEICETLGGPSNAQIVGIVKSKQGGTITLNNFFHHRNNDRANRQPLYGENFAVGDPVMYLENDEEADLYNGTFGVVVAISSDSSNHGLICQFEGKDGRHLVPVADLYKLSLAYAVTTHKAQGSQFTRVIVPIMKSKLLDRTMLYTALTRAKQQVVFIGDRSLLDAVISAPPSASTREVGFLFGSS